MKNVSRTFSLSREQRSNLFELCRGKKTKAKKPTILAILAVAAAAFPAQAADNMQKPPAIGQISICQKSGGNTCDHYVYEKVADLPKYAAPDGTHRVVQAMDICNGCAFVGFDGGYCRTLRMSDMAVIGEFPLGSNVASNHCGNLDFGIEHPDGSEFPALYVSGDLTTFSCYVEKVTPTSAELIQTIKFDLGNGYNGSQVVINHKRKCLLYMQRKLKKINTGENTIVVFRFRLPRLDEGDVTFTEADVLESYELPVWLRLYQGAEIIGNYLFEVNGIYAGESGREAKLNIFDKRTGRHLSSQDISAIDREPQGVSTYGGDLYIDFQDAIWRICLAKETKKILKHTNF